MPKTSYPEAGINAPPAEVPHIDASPEVSPIGVSPIEGVIIKGVGGLYSVATESGLLTCAARGLFRNKKITPAVGDRVIVSGGALHTILPRRNELLRPRVANVDQAIVVMAAAQPEFNPGLLDRFLLTAERAGVRACVCVNKRDLVPEDALRGLTEPYLTAGYRVIAVSVKNGLGLEALRGELAGKITVFAGPSGVGKSSLINSVTSGSQMETGELSARIDRGKHTTRHTELLPVGAASSGDFAISGSGAGGSANGDSANGGLCADTPGFTSLSLDDIPAGQLAGLFIEFKPFLNRCRFSDCRHDSESDCAVKSALGGAIHPARYETYIKLLYNLKIQRD